MVQKINCRIYTQQPVSHATLHIATSSGGPWLTTRSLPLVLPPPMALASSYTTSFREDTRFLIGQGRVPLVYMGSQEPSYFAMTCTLIGELVTPL